MKIKISLVLLVVCSFAVNAQPRVNPRLSPNGVPVVQQGQQNNGQILPIRRVVLYSNGVAYIERRGMVSGKAEINLSFKQSQVDDVLKSMVVLDLGQNSRIGAVSYNSSAPVGAQMAEIPFAVGANTEGAAGGMAGVLAQMQGAHVVVTTSKNVTAGGSILTVEKRDVKSEDGKTVSSARFLVIASEAGEISSFDLAEVRSVKLLDEGTRKDLNEFASATASTRRRDAKTITVTSEGSTQREMIVSYTIAAPIWKTTYRVVLDDAGKPFFQGWAIVDNVSDEDWTNVRLSLVSGTPISFIQPIQQPFYRYRPVVPIPSDLRLTPQIHDEQSSAQGVQVDATDTKVQTSITARQIESLPKGTDITSLLRTESRGQPLSGNFAINGGSASENSFVVDGQEVSNFSTSATGSTTVSDALMSDKSGVATAATGAEIGDLFEYKIDQPVTVLHDRSALIPIIQTKMEGERISVYNEQARRERPLSGLLLKNNSPLTFESGSLTVIDRDAYAGEALMERLKPKENRVISFALDLGMLVNTRYEENNEGATIIKAVNGTFQIHYFKTERKLYRLINQTERPRIVYIEHPVRQNWILSDDTMKPDFTTLRYHRFRVELGAFEEKTISVGERQGLMDSYQLTELSRTQLDLFISRRYINDATKAKLEKLIELRTRINQIESRNQGFDEEETKIAADQARLRENIEALSKTPEAKTLIARYIAKADEQETRLEQINKERQTLQAEVEKLERELAAAILAFTV